MAAIVFGVVLVWVTLMVGLFLLYYHLEKQSKRSHEEREKQLEAQKELFEDEDL